jgi:hypothetical protein
MGMLSKLRRRESHNRKAFRSGERAAESGLYLLEHPGHVIAREIAVTKGDIFPQCSMCDCVLSFGFLRRLRTPVMPAVRFDSYGFGLNETGYGLEVGEAVAAGGG